MSSQDIFNSKVSKFNYQNPISKFAGEFLMLLRLALIIYAGLALFTYSPNDAAWSNSGSHATPDFYDNWAGAVGAWISDMGFVLFGFSVFWILVAAVFLWVIKPMFGYFKSKRAKLVGIKEDSLDGLGRANSLVSRNSFLARIKKGFEKFLSSKLSFFLALGLLLLSSSILEWSRFMELDVYLPASSGGATGHFFGELFVKWFGDIGSNVLVFTLLLISISRVFNFSWISFAEALGNLVLKPFVAIPQRVGESKDKLLGLQAAYNREKNINSQLESSKKQSSDIDAAAISAAATLATTAASASAIAATKLKELKVKEANPAPPSDIAEPIEQIPEVQFEKPFEIEQEIEQENQTISYSPDAFAEIKKDILQERIEPVWDNFTPTPMPEFTPLEAEVEVDTEIPEEKNIFKKSMPLALMEIVPLTEIQPQPEIQPLEPIEPEEVQIQKTSEENTFKATILEDYQENYQEEYKQDYQEDSETESYEVDKWESHTLPSIALLDKAQSGAGEVEPETLEITSRLIEQKLKDFGVKVRVVEAFPGPVITRYEIEPATGVKGSQVVNLAKDLARSLGLISLRVVETIPSKTYMALELPNEYRQTIRLTEILNTQTYQETESLLTVALGKDIIGNPVVADLAKMPHVMVAGTTGSGKSVGINAMILSLLYKAAPKDVRLIMIDPKMLEMSIYEGIPNLLAPVVTDMKQAANALNWCVTEMERRYKLMSKMGVRGLDGFNKKIDEAKERGEFIYNPFSLTPEDPEPLERLPYIVVIIDELADLMMVVGKKIEELIARLAQKARAAGIHLILATQRPSVDVITGLIKANVPTRIAFQVSSKIDSRTILDQMGAETLLGMGDMLYLKSGTGFPQRVHGAFVSDDEVHRVVEYLKTQGEPNYIEGILEGGTLEEESEPDNPVEDEKLSRYDRAVQFVLKTRTPTISRLQRELGVGYNTAAKLLDEMQEEGIVSAMDKRGKREILVPTDNS